LGLYVLSKGLVSLGELVLLDLNPSRDFEPLEGFPLNFINTASGEAA
jgi:hypothetical protein